jgi:hypothetical protein
MVCSYEHGNELPGSVRGKEYSYQLSDCLLLKDHPSPCSYAAYEFKDTLCSSGISLLVVRNVNRLALSPDIKASFKP